MSLEYLGRTSNLFPGLLRPESNAWTVGDFGLLVPDRNVRQRNVRQLFTDFADPLLTVELISTPFAIDSPPCVIVCLTVL